MAERVYISRETLNPVLRGANHIVAQKIHFGPRYNYAYQIVYVENGGGEARIDSHTFKLKNGMFFLYGPGSRHYFSSISEKITIVTLCFSLTPVSKEKLGKRNLSCPDTAMEYWKFADKPAVLEGLPDIPFMVNIPDNRRSYIAALTQNIAENFLKINDERALHCKAMLLELLFTVSKIWKTNLSFKINSKIEDFKELIAKHYRNPGLSRSVLCKFMNISQSYLTALLKKELNTNFSVYLMEFRLEKAMQLILYSKMMIKEIAYETGFKDFSYFVYSFKKKYGKSPTMFRL